MRAGSIVYDRATLRHPDLSPTFNRTGRCDALLLAFSDRHLAAKATANQLNHRQLRPFHCRPVHRHRQCDFWRKTLGCVGGRSQNWMICGLLRHSGNVADARQRQTARPDRPTAMFAAAFYLPVSPTATPPGTNDPNCCWRQQPPRRRRRARPCCERRCCPSVRSGEIYSISSGNWIIDFHDTNALITGVAAGPRLRTRREHDTVQRAAAIAPPWSDIVTFLIVRTDVSAWLTDDDAVEKPSRDNLVILAQTSRCCCHQK